MQPFKTPRHETHCKKLLLYRGSLQSLCFKTGNKRWNIYLSSLHLTSEPLKSAAEVYTVVRTVTVVEIGSGVTGSEKNNKENLVLKCVNFSSDTTSNKNCRVLIISVTFIYQRAESGNSRQKK